MDEAGDVADNVGAEANAAGSGTEGMEARGGDACNGSIIRLLVEPVTILERDGSSSHFATTTLSKFAVLLSGVVSGFLAPSFSLGAASAGRISQFFIWQVGQVQSFESTAKRFLSLGGASNPPIAPFASL